MSQQNYSTENEQRNCIEKRQVLEGWDTKKGLHADPTGLVTRGGQKRVRLTWSSDIREIQRGTGGGGVRRCRPNRKYGLCLELGSRFRI